MKVINGERPERPSGSSAMSDTLWQNVSAYWAQTPTSRPATQTVVQNMVWPPPEPKSPKSPRPLPAVPETRSAPTEPPSAAVISPARKNFSSDPPAINEFPSPIVFTARKASRPSSKHSISVNAVRQGYVSIKGNGIFSPWSWRTKWLILTERTLTQVCSSILSAVPKIFLLLSLPSFSYHHTFRTLNTSSRCTISSISNGQISNHTVCCLRPRSESAASFLSRTTRNYMVCRSPVPERVIAHWIQGWQDDIYSRSPLIGVGNPTNFIHRVHVAYDPVKNTFVVCAA
jgi:protein-serine/threonine kinase